MSYVEGILAALLYGEGEHVTMGRCPVTINMGVSTYGRRTVINLADRPCTPK